VKKKRKAAKGIVPTPQEFLEILPRTIPQILDDKGWGAERRIEKEIELVTATKKVILVDRVVGYKVTEEPLYQIQGQAIDRLHKLAADYPSEKLAHQVSGNLVFGWETDPEK
jgi:hypothetical protein